MEVGLEERKVYKNLVIDACLDLTLGWLVWTIAGLEKNLAF